MAYLRLPTLVRTSETLIWESILLKIFIVSLVNQSVLTDRAAALHQNQIRGREYVCVHKGGNRMNIY